MVETEKTAVLALNIVTLVLAVVLCCSLGFGMVMAVLEASK